jgi:hypothetical protein
MGFYDIQSHGLSHGKPPGAAVRQSSREVLCGAIAVKRNRASAHCGMASFGRVAYHFGTTRDNPFGRFEVLPGVDFGAYTL